MVEAVFKNKKPNINKMLSFGFKMTDMGYIYHTELVDGQMRLTVLIDGLKVYTEVTDNNSGEEYILHRVADASGAFVGRVKSEYETALNEISVKCFEPDVFKSNQSKSVISYFRDKYCDAPEYLWKKFPDNAVVRKKENRKWYAAILTVSRRKLGFDSDEPVEILDLRLRPEEMELTVDNVRYFPGYHMNKKHWITICLDGTVSNEEIFSRIDDSYELAGK